MTNRCPITYQMCGEARYSLDGLKLLSKNLKNLNDLPYSAVEQRYESAIRSTKMSVQGVQPKYSAVLNTRKKTFEITDISGTFILKPQSDIFSELPENEAVTMRLAQICGIETPVNGLIWSKDNTLTYFIKRFDRLPGGKKLAVEDFSQLMQRGRDTKYNASMEQVGKVVDQFCTFPEIEKVKLARQVLFNFLIGNEDAHLKNFSLMRKKGKIQLTPAYDLVNSTIILNGKDIEEFALPINGKKRKFNRDLLIGYYLKERLGLSQAAIISLQSDFSNVLQEWKKILSICFLSPELKKRYNKLIDTRSKILFQ